MPSRSTALTIHVYEEALALDIRERVHKLMVNVVNELARPRQFLDGISQRLAWQQFLVATTHPVICLTFLSWISPEISLLSALLALGSGSGPGLSRPVGLGEA